MNNIMSKVFGWMFAGLLVTFLTGYYVSIHPYAVARIMSGSIYIILALIEIGLVVFLSARITKMDEMTAKICFLIYSVVSGLTFSSIFLVYEISSVLYVFLITALIFGIFAFLGMTTKIDLTKMGTYLIMGLLATLICMFVNLFLRNSAFDLLISIVTIIIFVGLTAYDVQKINRLSLSGLIPEENLPIYGALELYLDFINIFIEILRLFGKNRD